MRVGFSATAGLAAVSTLAQGAGVAFAAKPPIARGPVTAPPNAIAARQAAATPISTNTQGAYGCPVYPNESVGPCTLLTDTSTAGGVTIAAQTGNATTTAVSVTPTPTATSQAANTPTGTITESPYLCPVYEGYSVGNCTLPSTASSTAGGTANNTATSAAATQSDPHSAATRLSVSNAAVAALALGVGLLALD